MNAQPWQAVLCGLGRLAEHEPMSKHTTLGVGGPCRWYFRPHGREQLCQALACIPQDLPLLPLGRGSNLLFGDNGFPGMVLDLGRLDTIEQEGASIRAEAGVRMGKLAQFCAARGLAGVEFMATVPGDVGGGIAMNAGAFGQQVADTLTRIEVTDRNGQVRTLAAKELGMSYRHTQLPPACLVVDAHFALSPDDPARIRQRMRAMRAKRSVTQPLRQPNCGSVFKNPPQGHAAAYIEQAGLKGACAGGAHISEIHANFIVNDGGATATDVLTLIRRAQAEVERRFGIRLEPEVHIVGAET